MPPASGTRVGARVRKAPECFIKIYCPTKAFNNISLEEADAVHLPFAGGSFDAVTCSHAFYELKGEVQKRALREIVRVLKPGKPFGFSSTRRAHWKVLGLLFGNGPTVFHLFRHPRGNRSYSRVMAVPHLGHFWSEQELPNGWLALSPQLEQTQDPPGAAAKPPPRPCPPPFRPWPPPPPLPVPAPWPLGPVPSPLGILLASFGLGLTEKISIGSHLKTLYQIFPNLFDPTEYAPFLFKKSESLSKKF